MAFDDLEQMAKEIYPYTSQVANITEVRRKAFMHGFRMGHTRGKKSLTNEGQRTKDAEILIKEELKKWKRNTIKMKLI